MQLNSIEATAGVAPAHNGFADRRVATSPYGHMTNQRCKYSTIIVASDRRCVGDFFRPSRSRNQYGVRSEVPLFSSRTRGNRCESVGGSGVPVLQNARE